MDALLLRGSEKALDTRVIIGTPGFAHAPLDLELLQVLAESAAAILTSTIEKNRNFEFLSLLFYTIFLNDLDDISIGS